MRKFLKYINIIFVLVMITMTTLAYFVITTELTTDRGPRQWILLPFSSNKEMTSINNIIESGHPFFVVTDGLGRKLRPAPVIIRYILGSNRLWAGFWWHLLDIVLYILSIVIFVWVGSLRRNYSLPDTS